MEFLQHQGKHGDLKKKLPELPNFLHERWNWYFVDEAVLGNFVCVPWLWSACRSLRIIAVGIYVRAVLLGANCFLTYCQLPLGKHFCGGPLVTAQQWKAKWLQGSELMWHLRALSTSWRTSSTLKDQTRISYMNSCKSFPVSQLADDHGDGK